MAQIDEFNSTFLDINIMRFQTKYDRALFGYLGCYQYRERKIVAFNTIGQGTHYFVSIYYLDENNNLIGDIPLIVGREEILPTCCQFTYGAYLEYQELTRNYQKLMDDYIKAKLIFTTPTKLSDYTCDCIYEFEKFLEEVIDRKMYDTDFIDECKCSAAIKREKIRELFPSERDDIDDSDLPF